MIARVYVRLVVVRSADARFEVVRDDDLGYPGKVLERAHVGRYPAGQCLTKAGLCVGVAACAQAGHEYLRLSNSSGLPVNYRHRLPGVVHKHLLPGLVLLPHAQIQLLFPPAVELTELAVAVAVGMVLPVLLPQKLQGHPFALELKVDLVEWRQGSVQAVCWRWVQ